MKIKNINKAMFAVALAAVSAGLASCEDQPDKYETTGGKPTIYYIRPVDVASKDSLLTEASMSNTLCIVGSNLRSIKQIDFNDQTAVLNTSYMTDNTVIVTVPKNIPDVVTDKIYFITTSQDTVSYDFKVTVPAPTISSMSNEWAAAGEEVTIKGDYFLDYDNYPLSIRVGEDYVINASDLKITKTGITFNMPADMPEHENIYITTKYGTTKAPFQYMDERGMLFDFDTPNAATGEVLGNHGWHNQVIQSDETSLKGNYLLLGNNSMGASGGWNDTNFAFEYWAGTWNNDFTGDGVKLCDVADFSNWENKSLKFEMLVPSTNPWQAAAMQVIFAGTDKIVYYNANNDFFHVQGDLSRALYMPWNSNGGSYDTGDKWVTVTIPFTDFAYDWDGNKLNSTFKSVEDFASLTIFVVNGSYNNKSVLPSGTDCTPIIKIDNIRVVPNN